MIVIINEKDDESLRINRPRIKGLSINDATSDMQINTSIKTQGIRKRKIQQTQHKHVLKIKTQHPFNKEIKWRNMIQKNNWEIIGKQN